MKSYGQACGLAKALDVVGDRWSMLIVRELLIRAACRYTELRRCLPGVATNLLAERLRELQAAGLVKRHDAPPPAPASLFSLTDRGRALEPAVLTLGGWGAAMLGSEAEGDCFMAHWIVLPLRLHLKDRRPDEAPVTIALIADGEPIAVRVADRVDVTLGRVDQPAATVTGPAREVLGLLTGRVPPSDSRARRPKVAGDLQALSRIIPEPGGAAHA